MMIVRILHEGQYRLPDSAGWQLQQLDERITQAAQREERVALRDAFEELVGFVRGQGDRLDDAHLGSSDVVLPAADADFEEIRSLLRADGLIPGGTS